MKPATIRRFDMFYLAWVILMIVDFMTQRDAYAAETEAASNGAISGLAFVTGLCAVWTLVMLLLWYLVSRRRSVVAKWIVVVLAAMGLLSVPSLFRNAFTSAEIVAVLSLLVSLAAAWSLFGRGARGWFSGSAPTEEPVAGD